MNIFKKAAWKRHAKQMQRELDKVHSIRDHYNALFRTCYTTKQALELVYKKEL